MAGRRPPPPSLAGHSQSRPIQRTSAFLFNQFQPTTCMDACMHAWMQGPTCFAVPGHLGGEPVGDARRLAWGDPIELPFGTNRRQLCVGLVKRRLKGARALVAGDEEHARRVAPAEEHGAKPAVADGDGAAGRQAHPWVPPIDQIPAARPKLVAVCLCSSSRRGGQGGAAQFFYVRRWRAAAGGGTSPFAQAHLSDLPLLQSLLRALLPLPVTRAGGRLE